MSNAAEGARGPARNNERVKIHHSAGARRAPGASWYPPLFVRLLIANVVLLGCSLLAVFLVLSPRRVSELEADAILIASLTVITVINVLLIRRIAAPLQQLTAIVRRVDPEQPAARMPVADHHSEAGELARAFYDMLERLERERAESTRRVLAAHEAERLRVAQELHDEVGQTLTAVLLQLSRLRDHVRPEIRPELEEAQEAARASLEDVRRIATDLRPEALRDLGLPSALAALGETFGKRTGIVFRCRIDTDMPHLGNEVELAVYRVAQEALTNVARHSESTSVELSLTDGAEGLRLVVRDYGCGIDARGRIDGTGVRGMRERAKLIGAHLELGTPHAGGGSEVTLALPAERAG
jgi:two-component system, NarL family, sensor histidine kinase UhpB